MRALDATSYCCHKLDHGLDSWTLLTGSRTAVAKLVAP